MAYKVFTNGSTLQASELNENLMQQSIATFSNEAARTAAITSPVEGQMTYLLDSDRYDSWNGSAWVSAFPVTDWVSYTPTLSNITLGNGTLAARYALFGKTMFFYIQFTLGSTSAIGSDPSFSFPSGISSAFTQNSPFGFGSTSSIGGVRYPLLVYSSGSTIFSPRALNAASTYLSHVAVGASIPVTWASGNTMILTGQLEID